METWVPSSAITLTDSLIESFKFDACFPICKMASDVCKILKILQIKGSV